MTSTLKWRLALGLLLIFLAGVGTGVFAGAFHARHLFFARHGEMPGDRMRERLKRELDLTPDQLRVVEPILDETAKRLHAIHLETTQRVMKAMEDSHDQLLPHLTAEQQVQIEKMRKRHLQMMRRHGGDNPPPPPGE